MKRAFIKQWPWALIFFFCLPVWAEHQRDAENKTILLVNPPEVLSPSAQIVDRAMYDVFANASHHTAILAEHIIPYTGPPDELASHAITFLEKKYGERHVDLVMVRGERALDFVERYGSRLWPDTPIMYFSISNISIVDRPQLTRKNGISFAYDVAGTFALITRLQPSVRKIVQLSDTTDKSEMQAMHAELAAAAGPAVQIETLPRMTLPMVLKQVSELPDDTALLAMAVNNDREGESESIRDITPAISANASVPLYAVVENLIGSGAVGAQTIDLSEHGRQAAKIALQILANPHVAGLVQVTRQSHCVVDTRQMERWKLPFSALGPECERRFAASEFWSRHGTQVIAIAIVGATLVAIIIALLLTLKFQRIKHIRTETEAIRQRTALAHVARLGSVGELTASIIHEVNQPLGAIMANADAATMILNHSSPDSELKAILKDIQEDNLRASQIIQKLRTLLTKRSLDSSPVSVNGVIDSIRRLLGNMAIRHHATLFIQLHPNLPPIMGDSTHLQQILINLAANAMEAMSQLPPPQRIVTLTTDIDGSGNVLLTVSDSGPGIPADTLPHIFDAFYTTKPDGMGMGLAIVQTIVEAHHGRIEAVNNPQGGARFRVILPPGKRPGVWRQHVLQEQ